VVREGLVQIVLMSPFGTFYNYKKKVNSIINAVGDHQAFDITPQYNSPIGY